MNPGNPPGQTAAMGPTIVLYGGSGMRRLGLVCATLLAAFLSLTTARAETVEEFYKGKTVTVVVTGATARSTISPRASSRATCPNICRASRQW
jgi:hypothetical protein